MKSCVKCKFCIGTTKDEPPKVLCKLHKDKIGILPCEDYKHYGPFEIVK